ncbi:MAG: aminotransferase class III-fold pyridoxal phosphate-dependent enzyme [bacterium]|nr:aminotransferase class III-fold pyridoxal phosphate-dependent enzyme [bacterium]
MTSELAAQISTLFGLDLAIGSRLAGENENYLVTRGDERWVLKIETAPTAGLLAAEQAAMAAVQAADPQLCVPLVVQAAAGGDAASLPDGRTARLLGFVDGTAWRDAVEKAPASAALLADLGRRLGRVALTLADLPQRLGNPTIEQAVERTHAWDLTAAGQHWQHVAELTEPTERAALDRAFQIHGAWRHELDALPRGLIHGDANDENVLVAGDAVVGLLDFGDALVNPIVCDLALALAYVVQHYDAGRADDRLAAAAKVVAAYHAERALSPAELDVVFPLVLGRLAVTLAMCAYRRTVDANRTTWFASERSAWRALHDLVAVTPGAARQILTAGIDDAGRCGGLVTDAARDTEELLEQRQQRINPALSLAYRDPIHMARGRGQYLIDASGSPFLDLVNNVCHVGHCHPHVVAAGQRQLARLNTNTRYVYDGLTDYAERLCRTLPAELDTCFFVNSGSEANELALRLARTHTGRRDMVILDGAYHGHTSALIALSPYKFKGKGGSGQTEPWVHIAPSPDGFRGAHRGMGVEVGRAYGDDVGRVIAASERPIAGFLHESLLSCGGQLALPDGYLERAYERARAAGAVCIADEVQVGFARAGSHFWAFELQGVVPDIVVMGKPIGNGHPMAAVVARREIAESFHNGMEFFATFGGNPVSCAIGTAVLDVIEHEGLQRHALELGAHFLAGLRDLQQRHALVGDVRGVGLFLGVELVRDRDTLEPATAAAAELVNRMRHRGVLLSTDGPFDNVLKIKPPMVLTRGDVDMTLRLLDAELREIRP